MIATIRDILIIAFLIAWGIFGPNMTELKAIVDYQYQLIEKEAVK